MSTICLFIIQMIDGTFYSTNSDIFWWIHLIHNKARDKSINGAQPFNANTIFIHLWTLFSDMENVYFLFKIHARLSTSQFLHVYQDSIDTYWRWQQHEWAPLTNFFPLLARFVNNKQWKTLSVMFSFCNSGFCEKCAFIITKMLCFESSPFSRFDRVREATKLTTFTLSKQWRVNQTN